MRAVIVCPKGPLARASGYFGKLFRTRSLGEHFHFTPCLLLPCDAVNITTPQKFEDTPAGRPPLPTDY
jgi:hypothetical protein